MPVKKGASEAPSWVHGDATRTMKSEVDQALAAYCIDNQVIPTKHLEKKLPFKDLLPYMKLLHPRWIELEVDTMNTGKQKCMKLLCQHLHNIKYDDEYIESTMKELKRTSKPNLRMIDQPPKYAKQPDEPRPQ